MRYSDFKTLLEYDRSITAQRMGSKLLAAAAKDQLFWREIKDLDRDKQTAAVLEKLETMDPTTNLKYVQWLAKQYSTSQFRIEDSSRVREIISYFTERDVIRDFRRRGLELDINRYTYQTLRTEIVNSAEGGVEKAGAGSDADYENLPDMKLLYSGDLGQLIVPKTEQASCELGRGTEWCTASERDNQFDRYSSDGPLYVWIDPKGKKFQFHFESAQFMDSADTPIDRNTLRYFREENPITKKLFNTREKTMLKSKKAAKRAFEYAKDVIQGRWPDAEPIIAKKPATALKYAQIIIKGRFPEAESVIAQDAGDAYIYARDVIKGRFPEAESTIAQDLYWALNYATSVIKGRFPEAEPAFARNRVYAQSYAKDVVRGPFP